MSKIPQTIEDIKLPVTKLEHFEFFMNRWRAELIPQLSSSVKIEVKGEDNA